MRGIYKEIGFYDFMNSLDCNFNVIKNITVSILTWPDSYYFKELSEDDGGVIIEHYNFLQNLPLGKKLSSINELKNTITIASKIPYLRSINGNYKVFYDIHIWINNFYYCYNIHLNKYFYKEMNILEKLLHPLVIPDWQTWGNINRIMVT
jgi:hypothetical protein